MTWSQSERASKWCFGCISVLLDSGFDPWVGKIPWRRERLPTPLLCSGECHGLYSPWGHKELDTTERLSQTQVCGALPWTPTEAITSFHGIRSLHGQGELASPFLTTLWELRILEFLAQTSLSLLTGLVRASSQVCPTENGLQSWWMLHKPQGPLTEGDSGQN